MGLDTFASRSLDTIKLSDKDVAAFEKEDINLCEGMFSDGGASFRGKVYFPIIMAVTGVNMYQEWIPPETVYEMWQAFENCDPDQFTDDSSWNRHSDPDSINELRKFFKVCAELKLGLIGWW